MLFKKFSYIFHNENGKRWERCTSASIFPVYGVPVYVPIGGKRSLKRLETLVSRATRQAVKLKKSLLEIDRIIQQNNEYFADPEKGKELPD